MVVTLRTRLTWRFRRLVRFVVLVLLRFSPKDDWQRYLLAEDLVGMLLPSWYMSEWGGIWLDDEEFRRYYTRHVDNNHSADRKYLVRSMLQVVADVDGDFAECGTYEGATALLMARALPRESTLHLFDSFEGLSKPSAEDGSYWSAGALRTSEDHVRTLMAPFGERVKIYKGWIPETFRRIEEACFSFVHIDVDIYEPTLASIEYFYPRLTAGGVIVCDDYGFKTCPGAKLAIDEYMSSKPEPVLLLPTGQALIIKR